MDMEFNKSYDDQPFENYLAYLETIKESLPKPLFDFASDPCRHDFSETSLHDSWLKRIEYIADFETEAYNISLTLIGDCFDREFTFDFSNVVRYSIAQQTSEIYRDLITFEIGIEKVEDGLNVLVFRAMFAGDNCGELEIYAEQMSVTEKLIPLSHTT